MSTITEYFQSYNNNFWHYEDWGEAIVVPDGRTIGYSKHIFQEIIPYLAPQGLPRFGALLLAIAATNSQGLETLDTILEIVNRHNIESEEINKGIHFAKILSNLPARYKKGNLRLELFRGVFLTSHNSIGMNASMGIAAKLKLNANITSYTNVLRKENISENLIINDFRTLSIIGRDLDSIEAIMVRLTGLPKIEKELEDLDIELEKQEHLIEQLINKNQTFPIGALVTRLIGGLNIPFNASLPSEQPLGGVADITNKGNFDKLLMSEYAFDDHILMSRLANNESLYHHREVPPADNNYSKIIIIDASLKNWGTIRTISFATMLAITNHPKNVASCRVFLVGKNYKEIAFETIDDIIDGLQVLDSSLDPGIGLMALFTQEQMKASEIFFIGSAASLDCPGMQLFNAELGQRIDHWLHPNEKGQISVYKNPKRGKRFIQEIKLPLEELWAKKKKETVEITSYTDYDYPILFPIHKFKTRWEGSMYSYAVTKNRALLRFYGAEYDEKQGWEMITSKFFRSDNLKAVMTHRDLSITTLVFNNGEFELVNYPSSKRVPISKSRNIKPATEFYVEDQYFKCSSYSKTYCIDLQGKVSEHSEELKVKIKRPDRHTRSSVYQNLKSIYITTAGQLRIGKQDLTLKPYGFALTHTGNKVECKMEASPKSQGLFTFPDGSSIYQNRNGMLTLISSNETVPKIYIPLVLNLPLGIATLDAFAGNTYYQMKLKIEILLTKEYSNKLMLLKLVKICLDIGLKRAKEMVDVGLISSNDERQMESLQAELDQHKIPYSVRRRGQQQEVIPPGDFYNRYIKEFINHIVNHGTITN